MRIRETPMRVNKETTALELLEYLGDLEEVLVKGGRVAAIPESALIQIKTEFFWARDLLRNNSDAHITPGQMRDLFTFVDHVGKMLSHFEEVGGEIPPEGLPGGPER